MAFFCSFQYGHSVHANVECGTRANIQNISFLRETTISINILMGKFVTICPYMNSLGSLRMFMYALSNVRPDLVDEQLKSL